MHNRSAWLQAISLHAEQRPSAIALADVAPDGQITRSLSWQSLAQNIDARATLITQSVGPSQTMVVAAPSSINLAVWIGAAIAAGVRLVLMHPRSGPGEVASVCDRTSAVAVLADSDLLTRVSASVVRLPNLTNADLPHAATSPITPDLTPPGSLVLGSSGTTGPPRLVVRNSLSLDADANAVADGFSLTPADVVLCIPPLCHSYGIDMLFGTLLAGASLRVMSDFDAIAVAHQLRNGVTVLPGVPFVYESLARVDPCAQSDSPTNAHALRIAISAGSTLSPRVRQLFTDRWKINVGQLYGATELGTVSISLPGEPGFDAESVGKPLKSVSFRIFDPEDSSRTLPTGAEGHLAVRAPSMLSSYVDGELELVDGHLFTGDLARLDSNGRATITGRLKLLIDTGGFKVNPLEVESTLLGHPGVQDCAVLPLPLSDTVQRLAALIVPRNPTTPPTEMQLRTFLRERLAPIKIPRRFETVESIPRSPLGKLLRHQLQLSKGT